MWLAVRRVTRVRVAGGGDASTVLGAARTTFAGLADWCRPAALPGLPA